MAHARKRPGPENGDSSGDEKENEPLNEISVPPSGKKGQKRSRRAGKAPVGGRRERSSTVSNSSEQNSNFVNFLGINVYKGCSEYGQTF